MAEARIINLVEESEPNFSDELKEAGIDIKKLKACIKCSECASVCQMALAGLEFYSNKIVHAAILGLREMFLDDPSSSVWGCQSCNRCVEICPMDVKPFEIVMAIRRICIKEYAFPPNVIDGLRNYYTMGHAVIVKGYEKRREKVGLPPVPPTLIGNEKMRKRFQEILKNTVFAEIALFSLD